MLLPSGLPPSELSPHRDRAPLSRPPAPLRLSTKVRDVASCALSPTVSPTHTVARACLVPPLTMGFLFTRPKPRYLVTLSTGR